MIYQNPIAYLCLFQLHLTVAMKALTLSNGDKRPKERFVHESLFFSVDTNNQDLTLQRYTDHKFDNTVYSQENICPES